MGFSLNSNPVRLRSDMVHYKDILLNRLQTISYMTDLFSQNPEPLENVAAIANQTRNVKVAETSLQAYRQLSDETKQRHMDKIIEALKELGKGNYDTIAQRIGFADRNAISRRTKEMEIAGLIRKTGTKSLTSRQRQAFDYCICR